ncbi:hypothetical protein JCM10908_004879 [Rhodotorula pacifica]|uniref:uncharacterized protein n=1 Tax=Rhodotorula pacifica TaxID=1495444 RepID=UPI0031749A63
MQADDYDHTDRDVPKTLTGELRWRSESELPDLAWPLPPFLTHSLAERDAGRPFAGTDEDRANLGLPSVAKARLALQRLDLTPADAVNALLAIQYELIDSNETVSDTFGFALHDLMSYQNRNEANCHPPRAKPAANIPLQHKQNDKENVPINRK